ncbi:MAG: hypothetical protein ACRYFE_09180 [Janthinobacterium lividum]
MSGTGNDLKGTHWHVPGKVDHTAQTSSNRLVDGNGNPTKIGANTLVNGDPGDAARGIGQDNISEIPVAIPGKAYPVPRLDDDATQIRKIEDAAGTEPSPPGEAEPDTAREYEHPPFKQP